MKKQDYYAPKMEQVRMEAEMPVMAGSAPSAKFTTESVTWH